MARKRSTKIYLVLAPILVLIIGYGVYDLYKINAAKTFVGEYLEEEGYADDEISGLNGFRANLPGDRHWMVAVRLKDDPKTYYYFETRNELILESYVLNSRDVVVNKVVKTRRF